MLLCRLFMLIWFGKLLVLMYSVVWCVYCVLLFMCMLLR